jgi:hypothetical protein
MVFTLGQQYHTKMVSASEYCHTVRIMNEMVLKTANTSAQMEKAADATFQ